MGRGWGWGGLELTNGGPGASNINKLLWEPSPGSGKREGDSFQVLTGPTGKRPLLPSWLSLSGQNSVLKPARFPATSWHTRKTPEAEKIVASHTPKLWVYDRPGNIPEECVIDVTGYNFMSPVLGDLFMEDRSHCDRGEHLT